MARLLADEDFDRRIVEMLRSFGHDVVTLLEAGLTNQEIPDSDVLAYAARDERVLLTHNRWDYKRLHKAQPGHAGIIAAPQDFDTASVSQRIHQELGACETLAGLLILVNRPAR